MLLEQDQGHGVLLTFQVTEGFFVYAPRLWNRLPRHNNDKNIFETVHETFEEPPFQKYLTSRAVER